MLMLDTNICSYIIKQSDASLIQRFERMAVEDIHVSPITIAELRYGIEKFQRNSPNSTKYSHEKIDDFLRHLTIPAWNETAAFHYGAIRAQLESQGKSIDKMDALIGAHAKSLNAILVTNNTKHFEPISGLAIENWMH